MHRGELDQMKAMFRDAFLAEVRTKASASSAPRVLPQGPSSLSYSGAARARGHIVANRVVNVLPIFEWRTRAAAGSLVCLITHVLPHKGSSRRKVVPRLFQGWCGRSLRRFIVGFTATLVDVGRVAAESAASSDKQDILSLLSILSSGVVVGSCSLGIGKCS